MAEPIEELEQAIQDTTEIIARIAMPFPFKNKLLLTRHKLIYENGALFGGEVHSINVNEIDNVTASVGPIFGIVRITHHASDFPTQAGMFWRKDTIHMKRLVEGYLLVLEQNITVHAIPIAELVPMLIKLGTDDPAIKG